MAQPFIGSSASILRTSRSRVPCTRSVGRLTMAPLGYRGDDTARPLGKQGGTRPEWLEASPRSVIRRLTRYARGSLAPRLDLVDRACREAESVRRQLRQKRGGRFAATVDRAGGDLRVEQRLEGSQVLAAHYPRNVVQLHGPIGVAAELRTLEQVGPKDRRLRRRLVHRNDAPEETIQAAVPAEPRQAVTPGGDRDREGGTPGVLAYDVQQRPIGQKHRRAEPRARPHADRVGHGRQRREAEALWRRGHG